MKIIFIKVNGVLDYVTVLAFALIPSLFGLSGVPMYLSYLLAAVHFLMSVLTNYPLSVLKVIPVKLHKIVESIVGPVLVIIPWVLGFAADLTARWVFVGAGIVIIAVGLLTKYEDAQHQ
jgi:hypothetical protein